MSTPPSPVPARPQTLYRFHDVSGCLLYVGITGNGRQRVHGHASTAHWWPHVETATFEHDVDPADELTTIEIERPIFNVDILLRREF